MQCGDEVLSELVPRAFGAARIARLKPAALWHLAYNVDTDHPAIPRGDMQWRKGYKQACSDIIAMLHDTTTPS